VCAENSDSGQAVMALIADFFNAIDPTRRFGVIGSVETVYGFDYGVGSPGRRTVKTDPLPGSLVTVTSPPIMHASLRESARPSPLPP
jgi:hypothetical protein